VILPVETTILVALRDALALESVLLLYLLAVVVVAVLGGLVPAVAACVASLLLANYFFTTPYETLTVDQRDSVIALIVFVMVAATVSVTVDLAITSRVSAARSSTEAEIVSRFTSRPVNDASVHDVLEQVRVTFGRTSVELIRDLNGRPQLAGRVGPPASGRPSISVAAGGGMRLVADGDELFAEDRRLLSRLAATAARAWEASELAREAAEARDLAEVDRLRTALLAAVGHDLRTPLAAIKAAVTSLRQDDVAWTIDDQAELLATIEESADRLDELIANLLAMSRLQVGSLSATTKPVALDEVVSRALISVHAENVTVDVPDDLPLVRTDPGLLERAVANVVVNACHFSPGDRPIRVEAHLSGVSRVVLRVIDSGPGVPAEDWERMFMPFQRLDDLPDGGHGLGLAIARGFTEAAGGSLSPSTTPGGGLTMAFTLPVAE
jgi:K+-sensing histidine kinase KdpD